MALGPSQLRDTSKLSRPALREAPTSAETAAWARAVNGWREHLMAKKATWLMQKRLVKELWGFERIPHVDGVEWGFMLFFNQPS